MIIDLRKSDNLRLPIDLRIDAENIDLETDLARVEKYLNVRGEFSLRDQIPVIEARIAGAVVIDCSRCLEPVKLGLDFGFKAAFIAPGDYTEEREIELGILDLDFSFLAGDELDVSEVVREQVLLSLPTQIFCTPGCKGLCEVCGGNLNRVACGCSVDQIDPRWSALKGIK